MLLLFSPGCNRLSVLQVHIATLYLIINPPVSPSPALKGCSQSNLINPYLRGEITKLNNQQDECQDQSMRKTIGVTCFHPRVSPFSTVHWHFICNSNFSQHLWALFLIFLLSSLPNNLHRDTLSNVLLKFR